MTSQTVSHLHSAKASAGESGRGKKKKSFDVIRAWLQKQDVYTLHRPVRERFARNLYTVTKLMDVWECALLDVIDTFFR